MIVVFHPGDLGLTGILMIGLVYLVITALPIAIIVFVIYKVVNRHSNSDDDRPTRLTE